MHRTPAKCEIHFVDTTLRDGQLSLWALGMKTAAMLAAAAQIDQCGFESVEFFGFCGFSQICAGA
jgi:pyruvate/oxaloacetate carboxyltransferase